MNKHQEKNEKQGIFHWDIRNNNRMLVVVGKASTGKSSILRLNKLRKEYLVSLAKPLNEQAVTDAACSAKKFLDKVDRSK